MTPTEEPAATKTQKSESFAKRTTFYVNHEWEAGRTPDLGTRIRGQMYVESLEPSKKTQKRPIILIHGDYHSSQVSIFEVYLDCTWANEKGRSGSQNRTAPQAGPRIS